MKNKTQVNPNLNSNATTVNSAIGSATTVNPLIDQSVASAQIGDVIGNKYKIKELLNKSTGEADLFLCESKGKKYVAKIYRRAVAVKPEVISALKNISSPYGAKLYDSDTYNGFPYEILPYYQNGSLQGKTFSFDELKNKVIPSINEALHVLHSIGIIHKDLKPSNIMLLDNGSVSIIDFGISSVINDGNTVLVTKTGMTPEYSAPEALRNIFLEESDYYSMGITLYELFCGHTPYQNMDVDTIAKYMSLQRIPFPDNMPEDLKDLIIALTYNDLTHRNDKNNPNRRWTYNEVLNWCSGKKQVIPGEGTEAISFKAIPSYTFMQNKYDSIPKLVIALAENWEDGKKQLFRGLLSSFFKGFDPEIAGYCMDAEEALNNPNANDDLIFWNLLYKIQPDLRIFFWKGRIYQNIADLGKEMLNLLWANTASADYWNGILSAKLLSSYLQIVKSENNDLMQAAVALESLYINGGKNSRDRLKLYYQMAYLLSGIKEFHIDGQAFTSIKALSEYMNNILVKSYDAFEAFCCKLIDSNDVLDAQFEAWLIALGKSNEIDGWRKN